MKFAKVMFLHVSVCSQGGFAPGGVCSGGCLLPGRSAPGWVGSEGWRVCSGGRGVETPMVATAVGGTHPTGTHSY